MNMNTKERLVETTATQLFGKGFIAQGPTTYCQRQLLSAVEGILGAKANDTLTKARKTNYRAFYIISKVICCFGLQITVCCHQSNHCHRIKCENFGMVLSGMTPIFMTFFGHSLDIPEHVREFFFLETKTKILESQSSKVSPLM